LQKIKFRKQYRARNSATYKTITLHIPILYEDNYLIAVNKPHNILIHKSHYARNLKGPTLLDELLAQEGVAFYPIHRLDYKTSGVLLLCKKKEYVVKFQELFDKNKIQKTYRAIVRGFAPEKLTIDTPVKNADTLKYKDALTELKLLGQVSLDIPVHPYPGSRYSFVELSPKTGRMHQLRIHMNKISHPIVGDYKYGDRFHNRMFENELSCENMFLHAFSVNFTHPFTGTSHNINAEFSKNWLQVFQKFNFNKNSR